MSRRYRHLLENQPTVKVVAQAHRHVDVAWFMTLAVVFAGVFYFWGYYFWALVWRVLTGG